MAALILLARPAALLCEFLLTNQAINPSFANRVRWQSHYHVVRQSWTFFQNDFAGRIANRVIQTGPALRDVLVVGVDAVWYIVLYGGSSIVLLGAVDWRLAVPIAAWFALYAVLLRVMVPRLRVRSRANSEARSLLTGRVVDSYTNILTVKLFARARGGGRFVREAMEAHTAAFQAQTRAITAMTGGLALINAALLAATAAVAIVAVAAGRDRGGRGGDGAAAGVPDHQHGRLGRAQHHRHLRESGPGAGRHAQHRRAAADAGRAGGAAAAAGGRRDPVRAGSASATGPSAACCTGSTSTSDPASASASSAAPAPASRPWSTCCSASTGPMRAAS